MMPASTLGGVLVAAVSSVPLCAHAGAYPVPSVLSAINEQPQNIGFIAFPFLNMI
jgi:hypothetical protein